MIYIFLLEVNEMKTSSYLVFEPHWIYDHVNITIMLESAMIAKLAFLNVPCEQSLVASIKVIRVFCTQ